MIAMGKPRKEPSKKETPKDLYKGKSLKETLFWIIEPDISKDPVSDGYDIYMMGLIILNLLAIILNSMIKGYDTYFRMFEAFSVAAFTIDYIMRLWTCTMKKRYSHPVYGRLRYMISPFAIIDLLSFSPFYLMDWILLDLRFLRALRLVRLFRLFRILRVFRLFKLFNFDKFQTSLTILKNVIKAKWGQLVTTFFIIFILLLICSIAEFEIENPVQPKEMPNIMAALYWGVMVLTTVGSGFSPQTVGGKFIASFLAVLGIMMYAIPAGLLASGFEDELKKHDKYKNCCPHCHKDLDEEPEELAVVEKPYSQSKGRYSSRKP